LSFDRPARLRGGELAIRRCGGCRLRAASRQSPVRIETPLHQSLITLSKMLRNAGS
jgi:hypothetical protein